MPTMQEQLSALAVRRFLLLQKRHFRHPWRSHISAVLAAYFEEGVGDLSE